LQAVRRLGDQLVHYGLEIAGALVGSELAVRARTLLENLVGVLDFLAAPQLVHDVADEPLDELAHEVARGQLDALAEIEEPPVQAVADGAPFVLLDEVRRVHAEGHVLTPQLPQLGHDRLQDRRDTDGFVHASADVADPKLQRRVAPVRPHVPPDLGSVGDGPGTGQHVDQLRVLAPRAERPGHAGTREAAEYHAAIRLETRLAADPKGRARGQAEDVGEDVARHVEGIDQELAVLDADVHVGAEDEQPLRQVRHVLAQAEVALERRDILFHPGQERVRARRGDPEAVLGREPHDVPAQADQLGPHLGRRPAYRGADLHDRLVQLGLHLGQNQMIASEELRDVRFQLARRGIDDLVLFLDAERERGRLHRASTTNVGVCDPPPAVTLTRAAVDRRDMHPSTYVPWYANG